MDWNNLKFLKSLPREKERKKGAAISESLTHVGKFIASYFSPRKVGPNFSFPLFLFPLFSIPKISNRAWSFAFELATFVVFRNKTDGSAKFADQTIFKFPALEDGRGGEKTADDIFPNTVANIDIFLLD